MWTGFVCGVREKMARFFQIEPADTQSSFPETVVMAGTPDPDVDIWRSLSARNRQLLTQLVVARLQMRFEVGPGPFVDLIAAGLAEYDIQTGRNADGIPCGYVWTTKAGERVYLAGIQDGK